MKMNVKKTASNGETDALRRNVKLEPPRTIPRSLLSKSSVEVNVYSRWFFFFHSAILRIVMIWEYSAPSIHERFHGLCSASQDWIILDVLLWHLYVLETY